MSKAQSMCARAVELRICEPTMRVLERGRQLGYWSGAGVTAVRKLGSCYQRWVWNVCAHKCMSAIAFRWLWSEGVVDWIYAPVIAAASAKHREMSDRGELPGRFLRLIDTRQVLGFLGLLNPSGQHNVNVCLELIFRTHRRMWHYFLLATFFMGCGIKFKKYILRNCYRCWLVSNKV